MRRNAFTFKNKFEDPKTLMYRATTQLKNYQNSNIIVIRAIPSQPSANATKKWFPLVANSIKTSWDSTINSQQASTSLGGIFRDSNGEILASFYSNQHLAFNPILAEALALRKCMQRGLELGFNNMVFEGDCKNLVSLLSSTSESGFALSPMLYDI